MYCIGRRLNTLTKRSGLWRNLEKWRMHMGSECHAMPGQGGGEDARAFFNYGNFDGKRRVERTKERKRQQRLEIATCSRSRSLAPSFGERISGFSITVDRRGHKSRDNYLGRNDRTAARSSQHRRPPRRLIRPPPRRKEQKTTNARLSHILTGAGSTPPKKVGFGIA